MDATENPSELAAELEERHEMPRCAVDTTATLVLLARGTMIVGRMIELSLSGCRVFLPKILPQISRSAVECTFRIHGAGFRLGGVIDWVRDSLMRIEFSSMSSRCRDDLMEVLCEVELENQAKLPAPAAQAPAGTMALAKLSNQAPIAEAVRAPIVIPAQAPIVVPGPAPPIAATSSQAPAQPNRGRDRRVTHRCGVDTSAVIDLVKIGSKLAGQIVDLSVGGCRIRTAEKFPVGIYTRVETEFQLHGLPFRLGGVIQTIHNRNTVGIRFLDMSERKKSQVAELITEIEDSEA
jgi:hypothetical protein